MLNEVRPFVMNTANALGLTLFDSQAAEVHLPSGQVLTLPGRAPASFVRSESSQLESKGEVAQIIRDGLAPLMEANGFKTLKGEVFFRRRSKECTHELVFDLVDYAPRFDLAVYYWVVPKLEPRLMALLGRLTASACTVDLGKLASMKAVPVPGAAKYSGREWIVEDPAALNHMVDELRDFLARGVLPFMSGCDSLVDLDRLLNRLPAAESPFVADNIDMLVAHAAKNPELNALIAARRRITPEGYLTERLDEMLAALDTR